MSNSEMKFKWFFNWFAVTALILGCVLAYVSASGEFEFHDEKGNCWRCTPGNSCERCSTSDNKFPVINLLKPDKN